MAAQLHRTRDTKIWAAIPGMKLLRKLHGGRSEFRDFDLVFSDASFEAFKQHFERCIVKKNRFGGIKLRIDAFEIDAWPLSMTWAFRQALVADTSFANLPKTTSLKVDSIVVELVPRRGRPRRTTKTGSFLHSEPNH